MEIFWLELMQRILIDVQIDYALEVNYEHLADCTIKMKIASKEKGEFSLA